MADRFLCDPQTRAEAARLATGTVTSWIDVCGAAERTEQMLADATPEQLRLALYLTAGMFTGYVHGWAVAMGRNPQHAKALVAEQMGHGSRAVFGV